MLPCTCKRAPMEHLFRSQVHKLKRRHEGYYVHTCLTIDQLLQLLRNVLRWNRFATLPSHLKPDSMLLRLPPRSSMRRRTERAGVHRATGFTSARPEFFTWKLTNCCEKKFRTASSESHQRLTLSALFRVTLASARSVSQQNTL